MVTMASIVTVLKAFLKSRRVEAIWRSVISAFAAVVIVGAIIAIISGLGQSGLLDWRTIVSVFLTEVAIGVFLYVFLGEMRRSREAEVVNLMEVAEKFSHLRVYVYTAMRNPFYYIENTLTRQCYKAPEIVEDIVDLGAVKVIKCKNEEEMKALLKENNSTINNKEPTFIELNARS